MDDCSDNESAAMAAAMGFSSFGAQPSAKRRKYNNTDEAVVDFSSPSAAQEYSSAANATPLGSRAPAPAVAPAQKKMTTNTDEIALDDDDDDNEEGVDGDNNAGPGPQYINSSRPSTLLDDSAAAAVQAKIDSILVSTPGAAVPVAARGNPRHAGGRGGHQGRRPPGDQRPWWEDYYDPTANMNPWDKLEKERGLQPLSNDWLTWEQSKARWEELKASSPHEGGTLT